MNKYYLIITLALVSASCSRSQKYDEDSGSAGDDGSKAYYDREGSDQPASERIDAMGQPKKRLVVLNFWNDTPVVDTEMGKFAADELRRALYVSERTILPVEANSSFETRDFVEGDDIRVAQLVREGQRLGVGVIVIGKISRVVFRQRGDDVGLLRQTQTLAAADIELKVFDIEGGREVNAVAHSGESSSNALVAIEGDDLKSRAYRSEIARLAVRDAMFKAVPDINKTIEKMNWNGRIARVIGAKYYVNAGRKSGLIEGDILRVLTPGEDIHDPVTGAFLGRAKGHLKGTLSVIDFIGEDAAVTELHTGGQFREGDAVQLY